jgi:hypothetical protein
MLGPATAQITSQRITWSYRFPGNRYVTDFIIDRIRGVAMACDTDSGKYECEDPKPCQAADTVKPKF